MKAQFKHTILTFIEEVISSYSILFFSASRFLGILFLIITFFKPFAGLAGLIAAAIAVLFSHYTGVVKQPNHKGLFSFNALMIGIGMGTFYNASMAFWLLLLIAVLLSVIFSTILWTIFSKYGLPFLSIPFILCFWLVLLVSKEFSAINLTERNIYWLNEMYSVGDKPLISMMLFFENLQLHPLIIIFFKSLSSLFFQENILAGFLIFLGIIIHSRISASLLVIGFISTIAFNGVVHAYDNGINYYLLGGNFIMTAVAIGSFFVIPSIHSYLWAIISVPITFIITLSLSKVIGVFQLPVYSWPFCFVTISFIYFFTIKKQKGKIVLTPIQYYSPEKNLYSYVNSLNRHFHNHYFQLQLPFLGEWIVSQGYNGQITHKGDWDKALDFVIVDNEMKTYTDYALKLENFYCYNKPILAPANGYVYDIIDHISDNEIGKINQHQNWGNTIIIKHAEGLYSKMCHLKQNSFKVFIGQYVRKGDIVALCGNSGRSPEPHLHFQIQATPFIGSKTMYYPFSFFKSSKHKNNPLVEYQVPEETDVVGNFTLNETLSKAFSFLPGYRMSVSADGADTEVWEVFTDANNNNYFYCFETNSSAFFIRLDHVFYFVSFYGDHTSLLYAFYLSCYKIYLLKEYDALAIDQYPLILAKNNIGKWIQDIVAPFYIFRKLNFESKVASLVSNTFNDQILIHSKQVLNYFSFQFLKSTSTIEIKNEAIEAFTYKQKNNAIRVICKALN
ncbi:MAG: urea transporter [Chitinophagaceae bacterium]